MERSYRINRNFKNGFNLLFDTDFPPQLKDLIEGKDEKLMKDVDTVVILNRAQATYKKV